MTAILAYALFLALGAAASVLDWRERRIPNRLILAGAAGAAGLLGVLLLNTALGLARRRLGPIGEHYLPWDYYPKEALHAALSLAAGFALWRLSVWPAGDAKLFALCAALAGVVDPNLPGFPVLLSLLLLINIFVPAGLVFAAETVARLVLRVPELRRLDWRVWGKAKLEVAAIRLREAWPRRVEYLVLGANLLALFLLIQEGQARLLRGVAEPLRSLGVFFFMFAFWPPLVAFLRKRAVGLAVLAGLAAWGAGSLWWRWDAAARLAAGARLTLGFGMFLSVARVALDWVIERESLRELGAEELRRGVVLSDATWESLSADRELAARLGERRVDGLTEADAETLKAWLPARGARTCAAYRTIPFALWIFAGSLLTVAGSGNVVARLARLPRAAAGLRLARSAR